MDPFRNKIEATQIEEITDKNNEINKINIITDIKIEIGDEKNYIKINKTINVNDIIILNNNKALYVAEKQLISNTYIYHIHGKISNSNDYQDIIPIKLSTIKTFILQKDNNNLYNFISDKIIANNMIHNNEKDNYGDLDVSYHESPNEIYNIANYYKYLIIYKNHIKYKSIPITNDFFNYIKDKRASYINNNDFTKIILSHQENRSTSKPIYNLLSLSNSLLKSTHVSVSPLKSESSLKKQRIARERTRNENYLRYIRI